MSTSNAWEKVWRMAERLKVPLLTLLATQNKIHTHDRPYFDPRDLQSRGRGCVLLECDSVGPKMASVLEFQCSKVDQKVQFRYKKTKPFENRNLSLERICQQCHTEIVCRRVQKTQSRECRGFLLVWFHRTESSDGVVRMKQWARWARSFPNHPKTLHSSLCWEEIAW